MGGTWRGRRGGRDKYSVLPAFDFSLLSLTHSSGLLVSWDGHPDGTFTTRSGPLPVTSSAPWRRCLVYGCISSPQQACERICKHMWIPRSDRCVPGVQTVHGSCLHSGFCPGPSLPLPLIPYLLGLRLHLLPRSQASPPPRARQPPSCP